MARIPIEDNYADVINKTQKGLKVTDEDLAARAEVSLEALKSLKDGKFNEVVARRVARHLRLGPDSLVQLAQGTWYPSVPVFRRGFAIFNTKFHDMTVNSYMIYDARTRHAAAFDTGADGTELLEFLKSENLSLRYLFLTHTHPDHIADLAKIVAATGCEVWTSELEPVDFPGAKTFKENAFFHIGTFSIKTLSTFGHSPGGTTYYIRGLSYPLAIVGDSIFASSMGGSAEAFKDAFENNRRKVMTLPPDTVLACGHGPLTTVRQERINNPYFGR